MILLLIVNSNLSRNIFSILSRLNICVKKVLVKDLNRDHLKSKKRGIENPTVG
jgi:hypothetical protein